MRFHRLIGLLTLLVAVAVAGCKGQKAAPPPPAPPKVTVTRAVSAPVRDYWDYNGHLEPTETAEVRARVKGFLVKQYFKEGADVTGKITWVNGDVLYPGDVLYQIDKREYLTAQSKAKADLVKAEAEAEKAKADIQNWEAQTRLAEAEFERVDKAVKMGVGSKTDLDKAKATVDVNKAQAGAARATLAANEGAAKSAAAALHSTEIQLGYTDVRAPISGQIGRRAVDEGNLVGQSEPTVLTTIVRMDPIYVLFDIPERDLLEYIRDAEKHNLPHPPASTIPVEVRIPGEGQPWHRGEIDYVETAVNPGTGTVRVRGIVPNPRLTSSDLRLFVPGLYVQVRVARSAPGPRTILPEDAIMTGQEGRFVFVVGEGNVVEKRLVTLGPVVWRSPPPVPGEVAPSWMLVNPNPGPPPEKGPPPPTRRPIRSVVAVGGITEKDRVIVDGVQRARPGTPATPEEWAMIPPK